MAVLEKRIRKRNGSAGTGKGAGTGGVCAEEERAMIDSDGREGMELWSGERSVGKGNGGRRAGEPCEKEKGGVEH
jgi:hypothetical protein